jgi:hypothetical protein
VHYGDEVWDSSGEESDGGGEGGTLSDGEGRNKGSFNERRGGLGECDVGEQWWKYWTLPHDTYAYAQAGTALYIIPSKQLYMLCVEYIHFQSWKDRQTNSRQTGYLWNKPGVHNDYGPGMPYASKGGSTSSGMT